MIMKKYIPINLTSKEFLELSVKTRGRILEQQAEGLIEECIPYDKYQRGSIRSALDTLGVELANHGHKWTKPERAMYEKAIRLLS